MSTTYAASASTPKPTVIDPMNISSQLQLQFRELHLAIEQCTEPGRSRALALTHLETCALWVSGAVVKEKSEGDAVPVYGAVLVCAECLVLHDELPSEASWHGHRFSFCSEECRNRAHEKCISKGYETWRSGQKQRAAYFRKEQYGR